MNAKLPDLYAYVGEDELGSGEVGLKQGDVPAGRIPLVVVEAHRYKLERPSLVNSLRLQADTYGKPIRFVRYAAVEEVFVISRSEEGKVDGR